VLRVEEHSVTIEDHQANGISVWKWTVRAHD
jgi:hypothetical protein